MTSKISYSTLKRFNALLKWSRGFKSDRKLKISENYETLYQEVKDKIHHNCVFERMHLDFGKRKNFYQNRRRQLEENNAIRERGSTTAIPFALKYLEGVDVKSLPYEKEEEIVNVCEEDVKHGPVVLPYERVKNLGVKDFKTEDVEVKIPENWMVDYEIYDDVKFKTKELLKDLQNTSAPVVKTKKSNDDEQYYGSPDPAVPASKVKCGGCGANLHCKDPSIPGYLPSEIFTICTEKALKNLVCQRCHFLKEYNVALNLNVHPSEYPKLLKRIRGEKALVIAMVDMTDFPCSIWPQIIDLIGPGRPVIIVGNKVDLLPADSRTYLKNMLDSLKAEIAKSSLSKANIQHVQLVSAKTGYGIEDLITSLHGMWKCAGDVYVVGCTNVGKSTLYNALLKSDFCRTKAIDLLQRATISQWPGTTLNLLKFPIMRPNSFETVMRMKRLQSDKDLERSEKEFAKLALQKTRNPEYATLMGRIGLTYKPSKDEERSSQDPFSYNMKTGFTNTSSFGINEHSKEYVNCKWCYDTPGVINPDQILSLLTIDELCKTLPKSLISPRTYYLKPGMSIFIGGISRLDLIESSFPARFTVFASKEIPITVCDIQDAESIYSKFVGTEFFAVPEGNPERLAKWPGLQRSAKEIEVSGKGINESSVDVVLSSAGWIAVTLKEEHVCKLSAWTPGGRGVFVRDPPVLRHSVRLKGERIQGSPAYERSKLCVE